MAINSFEKKFKKTPFYFEMMEKGNITFPQYYEFLCEVWDKEEESRDILIKAGVANKVGMLERKNISLQDATRAIDGLNAVDYISPLYEINYIKK